MGAHGRWVSWWSLVFRTSRKGTLNTNSLWPYLNLGFFLKVVVQCKVYPLMGRVNAKPALSLAGYLLGVSSWAHFCAVSFLLFLYEFSPAKQDSNMTPSKNYMNHGRVYMCVLGGYWEHMLSWADLYWKTPNWFVSSHWQLLYSYWSGLQALANIKALGKTNFKKKEI